MKLLPNALVIIIIAATSPVGFGAGTITLRTDAFGNFVDSDPNFSPASPGLGTASWSGVGTITANLNGTGTPIFVAGTTGGTLSLGNFFMNANDPKTYWDGDETNTGVELDITLEVTGTNASFDIGGISPLGGGWQNFAVSNMTNVETLTITYSFSEPIAAMRGTGNAPYLVGMRQAAGNNSFNATSSIANLTVDGNPYDDSMLSGGGGFMEFGDVLWNDSTGIGTITNNSTTTFHGLTRLDIDGGGVSPPTISTVVDDLIQEIERTYATGMTWVIERNGGGALNNGSAFYFSFNGVQYSDSLVFIPESSSSIFVALGLGLGLSYRRRAKPNC